MTAWRRHAAAWILLVLAPACQAVAAPLTVTLRDARGTPVPGAVVYLQGAASRAPAGARPVVVDQRGKAFTPAVTVIQAGTEVSFPNSDTVSHHVYSFAQPNAFELPLYKGTRSPTVRFDHPGVVTLGCNIHDAMVGWIVVVETPYFGRTDQRGQLTFTDVPPAGYAAFAWSPRLDPARPLAAGQVQVGPAALALAVTVDRKLRPEPAAGALAGGDY